MKTVKEIREETGLTQAKFAERLGIPVRTLQQWEQGKSTPPDYFIRMMCYTLKYQDLVEKNGLEDDIEDGK